MIASLPVTIAGMMGVPAVIASWKALQFAGRGSGAFGEDDDDTALAVHALDRLPQALQRFLPVLPVDRDVARRPPGAAEDRNPLELLLRDKVVRDGHGDGDPENLVRADVVGHEHGGARPVHPIETMDADAGAAPVEQHAGPVGGDPVVDPRGAYA